ncbi:hypothetical protein J6590_020027 [Homalodisca vitripennis]|nr:hypothetical protein J6590_020027 [Homalodisca vitripennis]
MEELITFMSVWPSICRKSIEQDYSTGKIESSENIQETENTEEVLNPLEVDEETVGVYYFFNSRGEPPDPPPAKGGIPYPPDLPVSQLVGALTTLSPALSTYPARA